MFTLCSWMPQQACFKPLQTKQDGLETTYVWIVDNHDRLRLSLRRTETGHHHQNIGFQYIVTHLPAILMPFFDTAFAF